MIFPQDSAGTAWGPGCTVDTCLLSVLNGSKLVRLCRKHPWGRLSLEVALAAMTHIHPCSTQRRQKTGPELPTTPQGHLGPLTMPRRAAQTILEPGRQRPGCRQTWFWARLFPRPADAALSPCPRVAFPQSHGVGEGWGRGSTGHRPIYQISAPPCDLLSSPSPNTASRGSGPICPSVGTQICSPYRAHEGGTLVKAENRDKLV